MPALLSFFPGFSFSLTRRVGLLLSMPTLLLFTTLTAGASALPAAAAFPGEASLLRHARELLQADPGSASVRQATELLEKNRPSFPSADYLLLLAEAWYRAADPEESIQRTLPSYERTKKYAETALNMTSSPLAARYWLGLARLREAQSMSKLRAYFAVRKGLGDLEQIRENMPGYDHAGAWRVMGMLYRNAPSWSPFGDLEKALRYAREAVRLAADHPPNHFQLAQVYLARGEETAAAAELRKVLTLAPNRFAEKARRQLQLLEERQEKTGE